MKKAIEKLHLGVYGILLDKEKLLMVKKIRGPYSKKFDLPGGSIEHSESIKECLRREIKEETGIRIIKGKHFRNLSTNVVFVNEDNELISMQHIGLIYLITEYDKTTFNQNIDEEDVGGAVWVNYKEINNDQLSPFMKQVVKILNKKKYETNK